MKNKEYYYLNGNSKIGPLSVDSLKYAPISPSTMVWNNSLPDWVEARSLPELAGIFVSANRPPPCPPTNYHAGSTSNYSTGTYYGNPYMRPPIPDNYLIWAILATVLCCMPLGIVSIIYSSKVSTLYAAGDYSGAQKASEDAKKWAVWSALSIAIVVILYVLFFVVVGVTAGLGGLLE